MKEPELFLREKDKLRLLEIADEYLPDISIWAYGSRVTGNAHESSDLDIVLRSTDLKPIPIEAFSDFIDAIKESNIPILIYVFDWARLPESFHEGILEAYVVLR